MGVGELSSAAIRLMQVEHRNPPCITRPEFERTAKLTPADGRVWTQPAGLQAVQFGDAGSRANRVMISVMVAR